MIKRLSIVLALGVIIVGISVGWYYHKAHNSKELSAPYLAPGSTVNINNYANVSLSAPQIKDLGGSLSGSTLKISSYLFNDGGTLDIIGFCWGYAPGDYAFPNGSAQVSAGAATGDTINASIMNVSPDTTYYYEWYAFGGGGYKLVGTMVYAQGSFTTGNSTG